MKRILYILFAAVALVSGCAKTELGFNDPQTTPQEGKATLDLELKIQGAALQAVETRAGETFAGQDKENVTKLRGYAFVFEQDPTAGGSFSDNSKLLQKVAFKSIQVGDQSKVFITLSEQTEGCFIRLMTCMTDQVYQEMKAMVSQQMIDEGTATGPVTLFSDYKHISVGLQGYYANGDKPNPIELTSNLAFPLASPGIDMPGGISQAEIDKVNSEIYMVPVASKFDVTAPAASGFTLQQVTLLNGAKEARMRSTVLANDGTTHLHDLPLPINLGGVARYEALSVAEGTNTTASNPIYFYPNEGDGPFDAPLDPENEDNTNLSDPFNGKNPTYVIIKGRAKGYDVDGYYKIPIRYKFKEIGSDGTVTTGTDYIYDIVRNNHYKINLLAVNNPGYPSFDEAVAGPANDIVYDITIDDPTTDDRNELIVSNNGTHYMEVKGSEVYVKARSGAEGVDCSVDFKFVSADNVPEYENNVPKVYFSSSDGNITLAATELDVPYAESKTYTLKFNVKSSGANVKTQGDIIVRWGELYKKIPVSYENKHAVSGDVPNATVNGAAIFADAGTIEGAVNDTYGEHTDPSSISSFISGGGVVANTTFNGRNFDGYVYPTDRSKGIRRVLYAQASNFELIDYSKPGTNKNAQWSTDGSLVQSIVYRSTGTIYSITDGVANTSGRREYEVMGDVNSVFSDTGFDEFHPEGSWGAFVSDKKFSFEAINIGPNQDPNGAYKPENSHLSNTETLTLTNFADEVKVYKFQIDQYALPYIEGLSPRTDGKMVFDGGSADLWATGSNRNKKLSTIYVNNAFYEEVDNNGSIDVLGYHWETTEFNYVSIYDLSNQYYNNKESKKPYEQNNLGRVYYAIRIGHDEVDMDDKVTANTNRHKFYGIVNDKGGSLGRDGEGYYVLTIGNKTDEKVLLYMQFERHDGA